MTYFNFLEFLMDHAPALPLLGEGRRPIPVAHPEKLFEEGSFLLNNDVLHSLERACHLIRKQAVYNNVDLVSFSETQIAMGWDGVDTHQLDNCELSALIAGFGLESSVMTMHNDYVYKSEPLRLQFDKVSHPGLALQLGRAIYGENFAIPLANPFDTTK